MRVIEIKDVRRKDIPLYYRREFSCSAVLELLHARTEKPVEFIIEQKPSGGYDVSVTVLEEIDYPLVPIVSTLKTFILDLDKKGSLP